MRLRRLAGALEDVRLGGVIGPKVCLARDDVVKRHQCRDLLGLVETLTGLAEIVGGLGLHRSIPSCRRSCMNPVRSRYAPARKGLAEITAPVSSRISVLTEASRCSSSARLPGFLMNTAMS